MPPLRPVAVDGERVDGVTSIEKLREAANRAYVIVEPDTRVGSDGGGPTRGWGWWHSKHRPWHHAPEGRRGWSEREAIEDGLRATKDDGSDSNQHHHGRASKMAKKKRKAKVTKSATVSMARHRKALEEILALKATIMARDEAISKLVAQKRAEHRPGYEWVQVPIKPDGAAPSFSGTPTA